MKNTQNPAGNAVVERRFDQKELLLSNVCFAENDFDAFRAYQKTKSWISNAVLLNEFKIFGSISRL